MSDRRNLPPAQESMVNWPEIHRRLEAARAAVEKKAALSSEDRKLILRARAQALAAEAKDEAESKETLKVVEFLLASERYGIESSYVREICALRELTPIPCTPPFVRGIINLRGEILSVVDLKRFFDLPERGLTNLNKVIVIYTNHFQFGLLADAIVGVQSIPLLEIQPALPTLTEIQIHYLKGITLERLIILDADQILSDQKLIVREEVET